MGWTKPSAAAGGRRHRHRSRHAPASGQWRGRSCAPRRRRRPSRRHRIDGRKRHRNVLDWRCVPAGQPHLAHSSSGIAPRGRRHGPRLAAMARLRRGARGRGASSRSQRPARGDARGADRGADPIAPAAVRAQPDAGPARAAPAIRPAAASRGRSVRIVVAAGRGGWRARPLDRSRDRPAVRSPGQHGVPIPARRRGLRLGSARTVRGHGRAAPAAAGRAHPSAPLDVAHGHDLGPSGHDRPRRRRRARQPPRSPRPGGRRPPARAFGRVHHAHGARAGARGRHGRPAWSGPAGARVG